MWARILARRKRDKNVVKYHTDGGFFLFTRVLAQTKFARSRRKILLGLQSHWVVAIQDHADFSAGKL